MAFIVSKPNGTWEARESHRTPRGPRSRTLATFREFTPEVARRIEERSSASIDREDLRRKVARAGAPVVESEADRAAAEVLREISRGRSLRPGLARLLSDSLAAGAGVPVDHEADRMKQWAGASTAERAEALADLLDLGESLPPATRKAATRYPRIESG